jgi:hypothetical protein
MALVAALAVVSVADSVVVGEDGDLMDTLDGKFWNLLRG